MEGEECAGVKVGDVVFFCCWGSRGGGRVSGDVKSYGKA